MPLNDISQKNEVSGRVNSVRYTWVFPVKIGIQSLGKLKTMLHGHLIDDGYFHDRQYITFFNLADARSYSGAKFVHLTVFLLLLTHV